LAQGELIEVIQTRRRAGLFHNIPKQSS